MSEVRKLAIRGDLRVTFEAKEAFFWGTKSFSIGPIGDPEKAFLKHLATGVSIAEWDDARKAIGILRLSNALKARGAIIELEGEPQSTLERQTHWLSHFASNSLEIQRALSEKRVVLIGCGGTGSIIAEHLARAGVDLFRLVDPALIDVPDMNRQLAYFPTHLGLPKVEVLSAHLRPLRPTIQCNVYRATIDSSEAVKALADNADLIIGCADRPMGAIQSWICNGSGTVPVLFGGVGLLDGSVGPLLVSDEAKRRFANAMDKAHERFGDESAPLSASICFTNSLIAVSVAFEAFKYLSGAVEPMVRDRSMRWSFLDNRWEEEWR